MERPEQLAEALRAVARANHYMVGIVETVTRDELDAAEQILIAQQNALGAPSDAPAIQELELALDMVEAMRRGQLGGLAPDAPAPDDGETFAHTPDRCPSKHWNRGDDVCADCGQFLG
jgi:hypothetical protein